jgi:hypothetical protein
MVFFKETSNRLMNLLNYVVVDNNDNIFEVWSLSLKKKDVTVKNHSSLGTYIWCLSWYLKKWKS